MFVVLSLKYFPLIFISPFSGVISPAISDRSVDLPHPDGPTMATNSPLFREKEIQRMISIVDVLKFQYLIHRYLPDREWNAFPVNIY